MSEQTSDVFLDTSIQIARIVHGPHTKEAIKRRLAEHSVHVSSLVVRQEYKRRLLKEADYLIRLLHRYKSFGEVHQHVIRLNGPYHTRKRNICLQMIAQVHGGADDSELTERFQLYLRSLLVTGLDRFDQTVDEVRDRTKCACAVERVVEKEALRRYEFGSDRCSRNAPGTCGVEKFLLDRREIMEQILSHLRSITLDMKSNEIVHAEAFLASFLDGETSAQPCDPCLTLGDLLIALESAGVKSFFTLNAIESQHYCKILSQALIIQPVNPTKSQTVCQVNEPHWPFFGKKRTDTQS